MSRIPVYTIIVVQYVLCVILIVMYKSKRTLRAICSLIHYYLYHIDVTIIFGRSFKKWFLNLPYNLH